MTRVLVTSFLFPFMTNGEAALVDVVAAPFALYYWIARIRIISTVHKSSQELSEHHQRQPKCSADQS
jgi:hypothetical protein